jgi:hypothetical protein
MNINFEIWSDMFSAEVIYIYMDIDIEKEISKEIKTQID